MKVLVTGATGFLGSHVAEQLTGQGHEVVALVRRSSNTRFLKTLRRDGAASGAEPQRPGALPGVTFAEGSVEDAGSLRDAMQGVEAVVHCAGLVKARSEAEFFAVNAEGTRKLLEAAKGASPRPRRFVHVSSLAAVGPSLDGRPVPGDATPHPVTHYGRSKLEAERIVLAEKDALHVVIVRPPMIYGPRDSESFEFFRSVQRRFLPLLGDGLNTLSVIYGSDAAQACLRAIVADVPSGRAYFIDDGDVYVWRDMLKDIEAAVGKPALVRLSIPMFVIKGAAVAAEAYGKARGQAVMLTRDKLNELAAPHWICSSDDTRRDLGWAPQVKWAEGTRRAAAWYRENGWL